MADVAMNTRLQNGMWVVTLAGELTSQDADAFSKTYPWLNPDVKTEVIVFDMSHLAYMNSAGIALLIRCVREARRRQYASYAFGVSAHYQKVFRIVGLTSYMELFPDEYSTFETLMARHQEEGGATQV